MPPRHRLRDMMIGEISLVDKAANEFARTVFSKAADGNLGAAMTELEKLYEQNEAVKKVLSAVTDDGDRARIITAWKESDWERQGTIVGKAAAPKVEADHGDGSSTPRAEFVRNYMQTKKATQSAALDAYYKTPEGQAAYRAEKLSRGIAC